MYIFQSWSFFLNKTSLFSNLSFCLDLTFKVDELIGTGHMHSVVFVNVAGQKRIKLCSSEGSANAAKSQELRNNDTNAPQPWGMKFSVMFALSLTEEEKAADHSTTNCGLVYLFTAPLLFLCLSLSCTCTLQLTDLKTVAFLSELSLSLTLSLPRSPFSKHRLSKSFCHLSPQRFVSMFIFSQHGCAMICSGRGMKNEMGKKKEVTRKLKELWTS